MTLKELLSPPPAPPALRGVVEAGQVVVVQNLLVTTQQVEKVTGLRWKQPAGVVELLPGLA